MQKSTGRKLKVRLALKISHYYDEMVHFKKYQQDNIHYSYVCLWRPVTELFINDMWLA